jgi:hypothetical protein
MKLGTRLARQRRERQAWRKVLSDVDDTLEASGARFPAGIDKRYRAQHDMITQKEGACLLVSSAGIEADTYFSVFVLCVCVGTPVMRCTRVCWRSIGS